MAVWLHWKRHRFVWSCSFFNASFVLFQRACWRIPTRRCHCRKHVFHWHCSHIWPLNCLNKWVVANTVEPVQNCLFCSRLQPTFSVNWLCLHCKAAAMCWPEQNRAPKRNLASLRRNLTRKATPTRRKPRFSKRKRPKPTFIRNDPMRKQKALLSIHLGTTNMVKKHGEKIWKTTCTTILLQGRLGLGDEADQSAPCLVTALQGRDVKRLICGDRFTVALTTKGVYF